MVDLAATYQHIADILSFKSNSTALKDTLSHQKFNWDAIVVEGSRHLVLPAIYCRLKSKELLHVLPKDLEVYLKDITQLNRSRNTLVLEQIKALSQLFNAHRITHVFLKGAGLLSGNFYEDTAERMLGDIDVLISEDQLDAAFELLKANGYDPIAQTFSHDFFEHKHLPRLKTNKAICAVELHRKLFVTYHDQTLSSSNILASRQMVNGISIPSVEHLARHNILNYQINDNGRLYNSLSFRSAYDTIVLLNHSNYQLPLLKDKKISSYFNILAMFFEDIPKPYASTNFTTRFYRFKLKHLSFYKFWNRLLKIYHFMGILLGRIPYFLTNHTYRKALLKDRKRLLKLLKSFFKKQFIIIIFINNLVSLFVL
ncbi:MAG: hypothetical protein Tsb0033_25170 [Winogradskyella sp.]